jgi:DNA-binding CsgD family transcriptional regulator
MTHHYALPTTELSERELEVLLTYARLGRYEVAAKALGMKRNTVRQHLLNVRQKLDAVSTIQALWLVMHG